MTSSTAVRRVFLLALGLVLVACSPSADRRNVPAGTDRVVELSMVGMGFIPTSLTVKVGETVAFVVTNTDNIPHELFIGNIADQMAYAAAQRAASSARGALVPQMGYGIYLDAHGTGTVTYHFTTPGEIWLGCHLPGHWEAGMRAPVTVKA